MSGDYDRLRNLLLQPESVRLAALEASLSDVASQLERVPDLLADDIERNLQDGHRSRLGEALAEATTGSLELAVRRRPETVVSAVYPVIGPAIRRSLGEALRQMADDLDHALRETFSLRALWWRLEAWRSGVPYAWVVLRHTTRYQVEHLFLIEPESGLLLGHRTASGLPELDADAVAGMFTAINQFVRDSVLVEGGEGGIGSAAVGGYRLVVSEGPHARLVAFVRGTPSSDFAIQLDEINEDIHASYSGRLTVEDVDSSGQGFLDQAQLEQLNRRREWAPDRRERNRRTPLYAVLVVIAVAAGIHGWFEFRWSSQSATIHERLLSEPGLLIAGWDDRQRGRLVVEGLMDPLAENPETWLIEHHPDIEVEWKMRPFVSLEQAMVRRRVARLLGLDEGSVEYRQGDGAVHLHGEVPFPRWYAVTRAAVALPGVERLDSDGLVYPGHEKIGALIAKIEAMTVEFDSGTANPSADMGQVLETLLRHVGELQAEGRVRGMAFQLRALGFTDELGSYVQNRSLRQRRAEWLAARVMKMLEAPSTISIDQEAVHTLPGSSVRATSLSVAPYPVDPNTD